MLLDILRRADAQGLPQFQQVTPDMLPDYEAVRQRAREAAPEAPTVSRENQLRNIMAAFLGNYSWRPGERIGSAMARMGGAAAQQMIREEELEQARRDAFRREQQAHRQFLANVEQAAQTGRTAALMDMVRTNNQALAQAYQAARQGDDTRLRALLGLARIQASRGQMSPMYIISRIVEAASNPRSGFIVPGLDYEAARNAAISRLSPQERTLLSGGILNNPALEAKVTRGVAMELLRQFIELPTERQLAIMQQYMPLVTQRPSSNPAMMLMNMFDD